MLKKIRIRNFKCYGPHGADFNLAKINFIYGDNSVGKSSFLQFLELLFKGADVNRYPKETFDRHLFKGVASDEAFVSAQLRFVNERGEMPVERVLRFGVAAPSGGGEKYYALSSSDGMRIDSAFWDAFLPKGGGQSRISHKVAQRAFKESEPSALSASGLMDARFLAQIELETNHAAADYLDDLLGRLGVPYSCVRNGDGRVDRAMIHDKEFDIDLSLQDVGTGIAGLMDLAFTLEKWKGGILALEEPETNVNEAQLAALVKVLVEESMNREDGTLIVECHSELMVLMLKSLLAKRVLTPGELSVSVVVKKPEGSQVIKIEFDEHGDILTPWPGGFFPAMTRILDDFYTEDDL